MIKRYVLPFGCLMLLGGILGSTPKVTLASQTPEQPAAFVRVADYIPDITVDLKYYTEDNFTGKCIYDYSDAYLRYGTVLKLAKAQTLLAEQGYQLKIWDAFRTADAQNVLWEAYPDGNFVANPANGYSGHVRGNTVDVTILSRTEGVTVEMPTAFDDFSKRADRDYSDVSAEAARNAVILEGIMKECGFTGYKKEWWHYSDTERYDAELTFKPPAKPADWERHVTVGRK